MNANKNDKNVNFQSFHCRLLWQHWQRWDALWRQQTHHPGFPTGVGISAIINVIVTIDSILILIIIIIILISRYLAPPSSTSRPTRTDSKPRHCPPSPLAVPCSKETGDSKFSNFPGKKTAGDANFWLKKNPPENQSLRHNSRPDLTYRAPSPAGSFYQVTSTEISKKISIFFTH